MTEIDKDATDETEERDDAGQEADDANGQVEGSDAGSDEGDGKGGDEFDPARALQKIQKLNSENRNLRAAKKAAEEKAASASDSAERVTALEAENLRLRIGAKHGLPEALIDRLKGNTEEEVLADAQSLLELVAGKKAPSNRPKLNLRGGGAPPEEPEESDPRKLAAMIPRR